MIRYIKGDIETQISIEEANAILNVWTLEKHLMEISQQHDLIFNNILAECNYSSFAELNMWSQSPQTEYFEEANLIKDWYQKTWFEVKNYGDTVTESTQKTIENIITPFEK